MTSRNGLKICKIYKKSIIMGQRNKYYKQEKTVKVDDLKF